jgi:hypothetical protein
MIRKWISAAMSAYYDRGHREMSIRLCRDRPWASPDVTGEDVTVSIGLVKY